MSENAELILRGIAVLFWAALLGVFIVYRKAWLTPVVDLRKKHPILFWISAALPVFYVGAFIVWDAFRV